MLRANRRPGPFGPGLLISSAFIAAIAQAAAAQTAPASHGAFTSVPVMTTRVAGSATVGGTVVPFKELTILAQVPGRVTFIAGAEGTRAKDGDVLVQINDEDLAAKRRAALSQVYQADAALRNSYVQYSRELYSPQMNSISGFPGMGIPSTFDQFFTRGFSQMAGQSNPGLERQANL
jgi:multidrug efflux pump subunit AcrA (membrane-fusion protein)